MQSTPLSPNDLLLTAAKKGNNEEILQALQEGAALEAMDNNGWTALMFAAGYGQIAAVETLLQHGAELEAKNNNSWTPLMIAARNDQTAVVEMLLQHDAVIEAKDNEGQTPFIIAVRDNKIAAAKSLLQRGAALEAKNNNGGTALMVAAGESHMAMVDTLLQQGAALEAKNNDGLTPLIIAAAKGQTVMVEMLLQRGAVLEARSKIGWTPLIIAACNDQAATIESLLRRGAAIEARSKIGRTALMVAAAKGQLAAVQSLALAGAAYDLAWLERQTADMQQLIKTFQLQFIKNSFNIISSMSTPNKNNKKQAQVEKSRPPQKQKKEKMKVKTEKKIKEKAPSVVAVDPIAKEKWETEFSSAEQAIMHDRNFLCQTIDIFDNPMLSAHEKRALRTCEKDFNTEIQKWLVSANHTRRDFSPLPNCQSLNNAKTAFEEMLTSCKANVARLEEAHLVVTAEHKAKQRTEALALYGARLAALEKNCLVALSLDDGGTAPLSEIQSFIDTQREMLDILWTNLSTPLPELDPLTAYEKNVEAISAQMQQQSVMQKLNSLQLSVEPIEEVKVPAMMDINRQCIPYMSTKKKHNKNQAVSPLVPLGPLGEIIANIPNSKLDEETKINALLLVIAHTLENKNQTAKHNRAKPSTPMLDVRNSIYHGFLGKKINYGRLYDFAKQMLTSAENIDVLIKQFFTLVERAEKNDLARDITLIQTHLEKIAAYHQHQDIEAACDDSIVRADIAFRFAQCDAVLKHLLPWCNSDFNQVAHFCENVVDYMKTVNLTPESLRGLAIRVRHNQSNAIETVVDSVITNIATIQSLHADGRRVRTMKCGPPLIVKEPNPKRNLYSGPNG